MKRARHETAETKGRKQQRVDDSVPSSALGLESLGDDVLLMVMELCGLEAAMRAFFLANHHLHSLVRNHRSLWRRAYLNLFAEKTTVPAEEDYFEAYAKLMQRWGGKFEFDEDGIPLGETEGELTITVGLTGRATWEGFGVGCGRAGEYFSLNCLQGKGKLQLRVAKSGKLSAFVVGNETGIQDSCERDLNDDEDEDDFYSDEDEDEEEGFSEEEEEEEGEDEQAKAKRKKREEEKEQKRKQKEEEREKKLEARREERRKEQEESKRQEAEDLITEDNWEPWVPKSLAKIKPPYSTSVEYELRHEGKRKLCSGGDLCTTWQEDMEW